MLIITCPPNYKSERTYICRILFQDFLGVKYTLTFCDQPFWVIQGVNKDTLILPDCFFQVAQDDWLTLASLPSRPLQMWDTKIDRINCPLVDHIIPVIYGDMFLKERYDEICRGEKPVILPLDILGSAFFMLTRYEEIVRPERDGHDRFPATASLAYQEGFLERPIINEYLEILWFYLQKITTQQRKQRDFCIVPTHDVDIPYKYRTVSPWKVGMSLAADLIKRKSLRLFYQNVRRVVTQKDPYDTFDMIMNISEDAGIISSFYFMAGGNTKFDPGYSLKSPAIQKIIQIIAQRGHNVGFHPSYEAGMNRKLWQKELDALRRAVGDIPLVGGREHFLRFQVPLTWRFWAESGLDYDTTLGFADRAGFRCGTCYPFQVFDVEQRIMLDLVERPLILMECTVIDECYMHLGYTKEALEHMLLLKEMCKMFAGEFVVLWHNSSLVDAIEIDMYMSLIGVGC